MRIFSRTFLYGAVIFFTAPFLFSQEKLSSINTQSAQPVLSLSKTFIPADSLNNKSIKFTMKKKPWLAVLLSAIIPGAGQFYNKSYWKIPFIAGLSGYFGYTIYDQHKKYTDYRDQYSASQTSANPYGDLQLQYLREFYFNQRNDFIWYFMITYIVNIIDAYVDAHLFDFDVKEEKIRGTGINDWKMTLKMNLNF